MNLKDAQRVLMRNLKGAKNKQASVLELAEAVSTVKEEMKTNEMTKLFDISHTMLAQINKINSLDDKAKKIVGKEKLGIEQSYLLTKIPKEKQKEVAKAIVDMSAHETRQFMKFLKKHGNQTIEWCKKEFDQKFRKKFSLLIIPMEDTLFQELVKIAKSKRIQAHDLAYSIIGDYIHVNRK